MNVDIKKKRTWCFLLYMLLYHSLVNRVWACSGNLLNLNQSYNVGIICTIWFNVRFFICELLLWVIIITSNEKVKRVLFTYFKIYTDGTCIHVSTYIYTSAYIHRQLHLFQCLGLYKLSIRKTIANWAIAIYALS